MNSTLLPMLLSNLLAQIPVIAVCVVGLVTLAGRRTATPQAVAWAMGGFGLIAAVSFLIPVASSLVMMVQMRGDAPLSSVSGLFAVVRGASSLLHTAGIALLLVSLLKALRPATPGTPS